jgi:hypothetical protein
MKILGSLTTLLLFASSVCAAQSNLPDAKQPFKVGFSDMSFVFRKKEGLETLRYGSDGRFSIFAFKEGLLSGIGSQFDITEHFFVQAAAFHNAYVCTGICLNTRDPDSYKGLRIEYRLRL